MAPLNYQVVLACWSPSMDLLAMLTEDNQIAVYRLDWQKLWAACPEVPVTAMCWRPDGGRPGIKHASLNIQNASQESGPMPFLSFPSPCDHA